MEGTVTKLEARVVNKYDKNPNVVGTDITIQHDAYAGEVRHRVSSTVFAPPNTLLPLLGDKVVVIAMEAPMAPALPEGDDES